MIEKTGREIAEERRAERIRLLSEKMTAFLEKGEGRTSLEIGCGHGHWITSLAESSPSERLIGVDIISRRIRLAETKLAKRNLDHACVFKAEATEALEAWPESVRLDRIFLLHPDPWPKKRHAKNRMTGPLFLDRMAEAASVGTELFFRTDDPVFYEWSRESIEEHPAWRIEELPWPHEAGSYFKDMLGVHGAVTAVRA